MKAVFYHQGLGRVVERDGYATRIHWSADMLDYLRRHFATTLNEELAGELGVSPRTMIRKARELGLKKDDVWVRRVWSKNGKLGHIIAKRLGFPGGFRKGERANPAGEFKPGRVESLESREKRAAKMREWYRRNPDKVRAKCAKGWETRRANAAKHAHEVVQA